MRCLLEQVHRYRLSDCLGQQVEWGVSNKQLSLFSRDELFKDKVVHISSICTL